MNRQNFEKAKQFPLSTQALTFLQDMVFSVATLALLGGRNYILSGCEETEGKVSDGVIVIDGEILPFQGGNVVDTITIVEEKEAVTANGLTFEEARIRRYVKFATGTGSNYHEWAMFRPLQTIAEIEAAKATTEYVDNRLKEIQVESIPTGLIAMWSGLEQDIPEGWHLCDGSTLTSGVKLPDLRGKFVVGYNSADPDYNTCGKMGGEKQHTLTISEMPSHDHGYGLYEKGSGDQGRYSGKSNNDADEKGEYKTTKSGGGKPHENRPPYYVVAFIIKIATS